MMQVVGIVPTLRNRAIESRPTPNLYTPFGQDYRGDCHFHLRTRPQGPEAEIALLQDIRREIRKVDDRLPILTLRTLQDHMKANPDVWLMRTAARVFAALGALALLLAALGVYGVKAYLVARRTREIGIRMALGATTRDVLSLILRDGIGLALAGVAVGLLLSAGAGFLVRSMLYQTRTMDPITFGLAPLLLISASLLACYLPGRRAARVSPTVALRCE
jgi:putative ABC transport system permease protein